MNREDGSPLWIPDGIEPISAYRAWFYTMRGRRARLHPIGTFDDPAAPSPWDGAESGWVVASCGAGADHPSGVPDELCTCGFYCGKTLLALFRLLGTFPGPVHRGSSWGLILGRVELAGKIIEHDLGYRAERARVAELIPHAGNETNGARLASLLGVRLGEAIPEVQVPPPPGPPDPLPPNDPSSLRLRVREWVQDAAA